MLCQVFSPLRLIAMLAFLNNVFTPLKVIPHDLPAAPPLALSVRTAHQHLLLALPLMPPKLRHPQQHLAPLLHVRARELHLAYKLPHEPVRGLPPEWLASERALISLVLVPLLTEPLVCTGGAELVLAGRTLRRGAKDHQADLTGKHLQLELAGVGRVLDVVWGEEELLRAPQG